MFSLHDNIVIQLSHSDILSVKLMVRSSRLILHMPYLRLLIIPRINLLLCLCNKHLIVNPRLALYLFIL